MKYGIEINTIKRVWYESKQLRDQVMEDVWNDLNRETTCWRVKNRFLISWFDDNLGGYIVMKRIVKF